MIRIGDGQAEGNRAVENEIESDVEIGTQVTAAAGPCHSPVQTITEPVAENQERGGERGANCRCHRRRDPQSEAEPGHGIRRHTNPRQPAPDRIKEPVNPWPKRGIKHDG